MWFDDLRNIKYLHPERGTCNRILRLLRNTFPGHNYLYAINTNNPEITSCYVNVQWTFLRQGERNICLPAYSRVRLTYIAVVPVVVVFGRVVNEHIYFRTGLYSVYRCIAINYVWRMLCIPCTRCRFPTVATRTLFYGECLPKQ